ncbi:glucose uptake inhibitor SgrT [Rahnella sp. C60]|jgi:hypothetical protein|uniref:Glucose uptake inhibitor SgrT n=1 Tax=Rahnella perminowiae TaxID=2816244 RepID=A0ABS6L8U6_9GAMM|nr:MULTISPECIES: glucose uptake inhibitor SgrT [Rahnella]UJD90942.1 glucose uptake inhibitor SgrT [Rahnella aquatilis]MBU9812426.1 glucose uptake inhibitor SgrT [Rahnella perminowiae]MBU9816033.1 glucose uptake inhibitor SgrT [Rahnella perminowiae]MBU9825072.1 glucose uptake inhibitor SgrT [Rahnella perminowiae]MBU9838265.1 glucose uptake inhibitor SgrT [Rahnella perminowiae]
MKRQLTARFYQFYFKAIRQGAEKNRADWLSWVPVQYRMDILARLTQWDMDSMNDEEYRQRM